MIVKIAGVNALMVFSAALDDSDSKINDTNAGQELVIDQGRRGLAQALATLDF